MSSQTQTLEEKAQTIVFKIFRYDASKGKSPTFRSYKVPVVRGMTVLDALLYIRQNLDPTISFRVSCRMGICGSCGMLINMVPRLACQTQILPLKAKVIELAPLPNFPVIKDLVVDMDGFFEKHKEVKPYLYRIDRAEQENPKGEYLQTPQELEAYLQFAYCIKCGLCYSACPTTATDKRFLGPQALSQSYRYSADSRDQGFKLRVPVVDDPHGLWRCHFAGACSYVCPKGVDPALAIQLMKKAVITGKKPLPLR